SDLVQLKAEQVDARGALARIELRRLVRGAGPAKGVEAVRDGVTERLEAGDTIEQVQMGLRQQQGLMLVLAMQIHPAADRLAQGTRRHEGIVDEGTRAPLGRDLASDDHVAAVRSGED